VGTDPAIGALTFVSSSNTANALVLISDIYCANGVLHILDSVLLPVWYNRELITLALLLSEQWDDIGIGIQLIFQALQGGLSLVQNDELTVLFPIDTAFQKMEPEILAFYMDPANMAALVELGLGHIVASVYPSVGANDGDILTTLAGTQIVVSVLPDNTVMFNDAALDSRRDVLAINGLVHGIDRVLLPPTPMPTTSVSPTQVPSPTPTFSLSPTQFPSPYHTEVPTTQVSTTIPETSTQPTEIAIPIVETENLSDNERLLTKGASAGIAVGAFIIVALTVVFTARQWCSKTKVDGGPFVQAVQVHAVPEEEMVASSVSPDRDTLPTLRPDIIEVLPSADIDLFEQSRKSTKTRNYEVVDLDTLEVVGTSSGLSASHDKDLPEYKDQVRAQV